MKIIIEATPEIDNPEKVTFEYFKDKCKDALNKFKLEIEGTDLKYEQ